jgi:hypothetical protein
MSKISTLIHSKKSNLIFLHNFVGIIMLIILIDLSNPNKLRGFLYLMKIKIGRFGNA